MFTCSNNDGPIIRIIVTTVTGVQVSIGLHSMFTKLQEDTVDSTSVKGEVIDANSTYFVATITLVPPVSSTIVCNDETKSYHLQNCKWSLLSTIGAPKFLLGFYVGMQSRGNLAGLPHKYWLYSGAVFNTLTIFKFKVLESS